MFEADSRVICMTHINMEFLFKSLLRAENFLAHMQGKGYGGVGTISQEVAAVSTFCIDPKIVIDVGANIGAYSAAIRKQYPTVEIHLFEPAPANIAKLESRFATDPNVRIRNEALGASNQTGLLHFDAPGSGLASLTRRDLQHVGRTFNQSCAVTIRRFEEYWKTELGCKQIDLAKLDVEGHELDVLHGFGAALEATKVIQFEFGGCNIDTRTNWRDHWRLFEASAFYLYRISPFGLRRVRGYAESDEYYGTTNYVALNSRFVPSGLGADQ